MPGHSGILDTRGSRAAVSARRWHPKGSNEDSTHVVFVTDWCKDSSRRQVQPLTLVMYTRLTYYFMGVFIVSLFLTPSPLRTNPVVN